MHVSIAVTLIISIISSIIRFVVAAHAARSLTVQEAQVSETGGGHELRQLPRLDPGEEEEEVKPWRFSVLSLWFSYSEFNFFLNFFS